MSAITGATGHLGPLVIAALLDQGVPAGEIVAIVRDPGKAAALAAQGVQVRQAAYARSDALRGVDTLRLVSLSAVGSRVAQHRTVVDAARETGVTLLAYTSILKADTSPLLLAAEHNITT